MRHSRVRDDAAVITSAAPSPSDQHDLRRRKYLTMMGIRIVCVIAAVCVASFSLWLALVFMVGGAVLPWCAVLIANDRPPQRSTAFVHYRAPKAQAPTGAAARPIGLVPTGAKAIAGPASYRSPTPSASRSVYVVEDPHVLDSGSVRGSDPEDLRGSA